MKAVRVAAFGQPPGLEDVPAPEIERPDDVLVRVAAAGVCHTDLHIAQGLMVDAGARAPLTLGHENAGYVAAAGPAVKDLRPGTPVLVHPAVSCGAYLACRRGEDMYCDQHEFVGLTRDGGFAELLRVTRRNLLALPDDADLVALAAHADAGITAYRAVRKILPLAGPGATVVVLGIGGLGHIAVQLLRALTGARIVALDVDPARLDLARRLGADEVVPAGDGQVDRVRDLDGGRGVDVVIDFVGVDATLRDGIAMLRRGGTYSLVGYGGTLQVPAVALIAGEVSVVGNLVGNFSDLHELVRLHLTGAIRVLTQTFALEDAPEVLSLLEAGKVTGRAVLVPSTEHERRSA